MASPFRMEFKKKSGGGGKRKREDAPKKHRSFEFRRGSSSGVETKLSSLDVRSLVNDVDAHIIIRPLGEEVEVFTSQETVYLESAVEEDTMGRLEKRLKELEGKLTQGCEASRKDCEAFRKDLEASRKELKSLSKRLEVCELFLHQSKSTALQTFCDLVLAAFFKACGKEAGGFEERAAWLADREGGEAFVTREPVTLRVFGVEKRIGKREFHLIKSLRHASSELSLSVLHSATPLEVATALEGEGTSVFAGEFGNICALFQMLFDVTFEKMVKDWKEGNLNEEFNQKFKPARPPASHLVTKTGVWMSSSWRTLGGGKWNKNCDEGSFVNILHVVKMVLANQITTELTTTVVVMSMGNRYV